MTTNGGTRSAVVVACIGAVASLIGAFAGYRVAQIQYGLDHVRLVADLIFRIAPLDSDPAKNTVRYLARSQTLRAEMIDVCQVFRVGEPDCPRLPK
jgi:hypothetical protein